MTMLESSQPLLRYIILTHVAYPLHITASLFSGVPACVSKIGTLGECCVLVFGTLVLLAGNSQISGYRLVDKARSHYSRGTIYK